MCNLRILTLDEVRLMLSKVKLRTQLDEVIDLLGRSGSVNLMIEELDDLLLRFSRQDGGYWFDVTLPPGTAGDKFLGWLIFVFGPTFQVRGELAILPAYAHLEGRLRKD
jgi:hypothetical protein